jgi:DNA-binding MarR family transcriptional regulator/N-acetylglutamate synthase-like GNAT family acetyltransferase
MQEDIDRVRQFNRFYTKQIGVLTPQYLDSGFSLAELRTLYELAHREQPSASEISEQLGLDPGYLSRILRSFEKRGLIARKPSKQDARRTDLLLTKNGRARFDREQVRTSSQIGKMIEPLNPEDRSQLVHAMQRVQSILAGPPAANEPYILRQHRSGDMGWIVHRHGVLYGREGYDQTFEALVAEIAAKFIHDFDAQCERCWIAERNGEMVGSVLVVRVSKTVAKLRLLLVEPSARGLGLGSRLVQECIRFTRDCGYKKLILWTERTLVAARSIYESEGFRHVQSEPERKFGKDRVFETWELKL